METGEHSTDALISPAHNKSHDLNPKRYGRRAFVLINLATFFYIFSTVLQTSLSVQFVFSRVKSQYNNTGISNTSACETEQNDSQYKTLEEIGEKAAEIQIYLSVATGLPSIIACLIFGSLSDRLGRKFLFALPIGGMLVRSSVYAIVSFCDVSLYYLFIGHILDGFSGGFSCLLLASFAGFSDLTTGGKKRSFVIAIIEATSVLSAGGANLILGFMIEALGYTYPNILVIAISVINLVFIIFALPETRPKKIGEKINFRVFKAGFQRVFSFYTDKGEGLIRCRLILCWLAFFLTSATFIGSIPVETLYLKNRPLCWGSIEIGYFASLKAVCSALAASLLIRLIQICLGDVGIGISCGLAKIASYILQGFADTDLKMYAAAVVGMPAIGVMAMTRSIMSKSTSSEHLGSMFASIACAEAATSMIGGVLFSAIYKVTIHEQPGAIFFVMAGILGVVVLLYGGIFCVMRKDRPVHCLVVEERTPLLSEKEADHQTVS